MTHHRKSSSEKLMGGVGDHGPKMGIWDEEAALRAKKAMGERVHVSGRRGRRGRHRERALQSMSATPPKITVTVCDDFI